MVVDFDFYCLWIEKAWLVDYHITLPLAFLYLFTLLEFATFCLPFQLYVCASRKPAKRGVKKLYVSINIRNFLLILFVDSLQTYQIPWLQNNTMNADCIYFLMLVVGSWLFLLTFLQAIETVILNLVGFTATALIEFAQESGIE